MTNINCAWHKGLIEAMEKEWAKAKADAPTSSELTVYLTKSAMDHFEREGVDVQDYYWSQFGARVKSLEDCLMERAA